MGTIPWWGYLLVWIISFSVYLTIYVFQINQAVIKNKDGYGYKINFIVTIAFILMFSFVSWANLLFPDVPLVLTITAT